MDAPAEDADRWLSAATANPNVTLPPSRVDPSAFGVEVLAPDVIAAALWSGTDADTSLYAVVDGQWATGLYGRLMASGLQYCNLFEGPAAQSRIQESPYLVRLEPENQFTGWLLEEAWGNGWCIFFQASATHAGNQLHAPDYDRLSSMRARGFFQASEALEGEKENTTLLLRRHFRRFTRVEFDEDGRVVLFRFYDPSVLHTWLRSANPDELNTFFGPIKQFFAEGYCELDSLNRPHKLYRFYRQFEEGSKSVLSIQCFNGRTDQVKDLAPFEASTDALASYKQSPYVIIQPKVQKEFARRQMEILIGKIADYFVGNERLETHNRKTVTELVRRYVDQASNDGLETEIDLLNYAICIHRHGREFEDEFMDVKADVLDKQEGWVAEGDALAEWSVIEPGMLSSQGLGNG